jgi:hypothetical protein
MNAYSYGLRAYCSPKAKLGAPQIRNRQCGLLALCR